MPGRLLVFGRLSLPLTADDLSLPALFGVLCRSAALVGAVVLLAVQQSAAYVSPTDTIFQAITLVLIAITFVAYIVFYRVSSAGQVLDWKKRTVRTTRVFHVLAVFYVLEVCLCAFGIAIIATAKQYAVTVLVTVIAILIDIGVLGFVLSLLLMLSRGRRPRPIRSSGDYREIIRFGAWAMSLACCKLFGTIESPMGQEEVVWSEISRVVHGFMKDMLVDFSVSDIFAAFVLVWVEQHGTEDKRVEHAFSSVGYAGSPRSDVRFKSQTIPSSSPITPSDTAAVEAMKDFERFSPFVLGIYGWKLSMFMNCCGYVMRWPGYVLKRLIFGKHWEEHVHNDVAGIDGVNRQLVYASWTSYMGEAIPYTICVDHMNKAVVVTTRGTMSVGDIATDLLCTPMKLGDIGRAWGVPDSDKHYLHGGMLRVAHRIREDIERQQVLHRLLNVRRESLEETESRHRTLGEELLTDEDRQSFLSAMGRSSKGQLPEGLMFNATTVGEQELDASAKRTSGYRLVVCGHSLGACMASILSLLLRSRFPQLRCFAYSCVSQIFSRELAEESSAWITSCTLGKDIFGRLSWHSAKALRDRLLDVLRRSKTNKQTIFLSLFAKISMDTLLYPPDRVPNDDFRKDVLTKLSVLQREDAESMLDTVHMYMPGRILYLEKTHTTVISKGFLGFGSKKRSTYTPVWIEDRSAIQELQISTRLIADHMPQYLVDVMSASLKDVLTSQVNGAQRLLSASSVPPQVEV